MKATIKPCYSLLDKQPLLAIFFLYGNRVSMALRKFQLTLTKLKS